MAVKMAKNKDQEYAPPLWRKVEQNSDVPLVVPVLSARGSV